MRPRTRRRLGICVVACAGCCFMNFDMFAAYLLGCSVTLAWFAPDPSDVGGGS